MSVASEQFRNPTAKTETQYREAWRSHFAEMKAILAECEPDRSTLANYQYEQMQQQFESLLDQACKSLDLPKVSQTSIDAFNKARIL